MTRRQVELAILKAGALRLAGLADLRRRGAVDPLAPVYGLAPDRRSSRCQCRQTTGFLGYQTSPPPGTGPAGYRECRRIFRPGRPLPAAAAAPRAALVPRCSAGLAPAPA